MVSKKHANTRRARKGSAASAATLYETDLLRRYPNIAPHVRDAWSEGR
jgi:hypothetical protein